MLQDKKLDVVVVVLVFAALSGCRRSTLETVPVRGTVTYQGKPVPYGLVKFQPVDASRGRSVLTAITSDGTYDVQTLQDARGLVPGEYLVTVTIDRPPVGRDDRRRSQSAQASDSFPRIVRSGIQFAVNSGDGNKTFDIPLDEVGQAERNDDDETGTKDLR